MDPQRLINAILMAAAFGLVFSAWSICMVLWIIQYVRRQRQVRKRLGLGGPEAQQSQALQLWREGYEALAETGEAKKETLRQRLERLRADAGWRLPAYAVFLAVAALAGLALTAAVMLGAGIWIGMAAAAVVLVTFRLHTERRIAKRVGLFERQFVDSLGIAARALRAGHPLVGAFQLIAAEVDDPMGSIFGGMCQEQALGLDLQESIRRVADTSRNPDLKIFATAVTIQLGSGGNLAELMDSLAAVMRSRMRLHRRVRVLTAQTQMSKRILIGLPILLFLILNIIAPTYMHSFYVTWSGRYMLAATIGSILLGTWMMGKLSVLHY
jgi:tight adherence protein B